MADYDKAITVLEALLNGDAPTADEIREIAIELTDAANETLAELEALLDDAAKADIEARKQAKRDAREAERRAFEEMISKARKDAEDRLKALKAARETK